MSKFRDPANLSHYYAPEPLKFGPIKYTPDPWWDSWQFFAILDIVQAVSFALLGICLLALLLLPRRR